MSATVIPFPRMHRDEEERLLAEWHARTMADPVRRELLEKARKAIAALPRQLPGNGTD